MKRLKTILVAFVMTMSLTMYAAPSSGLNDIKSVSYEIEELLKQSFCDLEDGFTVTLFFSVSEDHKIQQLMVASPDLRVSEFLQKKLQDRLLTGTSWRLGKIYELSVSHVRDRAVTAVSRY